MWLIFALFGYGALAGGSILEKFIISKVKVSPLRDVFYSTLPVLLIAVLIPFGVPPITTLSGWFFAAVSGFAYAGAMWAMFISFLRSEVSHAGPLQGAAAALGSVVMGILFLSEKFSGLQYFGVSLLILGAFLISLEKSKLHRGWHSGLSWAAFSGVLFAISNVAAKYVYNQFGFYSGFVWSRVALGLSGFFFLFFPEIRRLFFGSKKSNLKLNAKPTPGNFKQFIIVTLVKLVGVGAVILLQYATALGSVAMVNALIGVQFALLIMVMYLISKFKRGFLTEYYAKGELTQEVIAIILIAAGLGLILV